MDSKDLKQVAIVSGSSTGIGRETALSLAIDGMKVFMACRSADRGREAASYIREACPGAVVEVLLLDLETLESVRKCAADFQSRNLPLKLLVINVSSIMSRESKFPDPECIGGREQKHLLFAAWILGRNSSEISKLAIIRFASLQTFCLPLNCNGDGKVFEGKGI